MARDKKVEHLAGVRLFRSLSPKQIELIAKIADVVTLPAGTKIVTQGDVGHEFYLVVSGAATVERNGEKVASLGEGDYFGELAVLGHGTRNATVVADGEIELLVIGQREFRTVLDDVPAMAYTILTTMAERLSEADSRAASH
ncbi:MAG TPA: cyclic nucleotide-binding domain-containing protein [Acidimicrobiales bacterium]|nr:cyclic nucleotide-binding domain-containing protein [Acidimicrobiales bacterium]